MDTREITKKLSEKSTDNKNHTKFALGRGHIPEKNTSTIHNATVCQSYVETRELKHDPQLKSDSPLGYHYEVENRDINNNRDIEHTASGTRVTLSKRT